MNILLFLENCIIGNTTFLEQEYYLYRFINNLHRDVQSYKPKYENLIRPGVLEFIKKYKNKSKFYIFSKTSISWLEFFIPYVEKQLNIKFTKPYFGNNTFNNKVFPLDTIYQSIIYPKLSKTQQKRNIKDNLLVVTCYNDQIITNKECVHIVDFYNPYYYRKLDILYPKDIIDNQDIKKELNLCYRHIIFKMTNNTYYYENMGYDEIIDNLIQSYMLKFVELSITQYKDDDCFAKLLKEL